MYQNVEAYGKKKQGKNAGAKKTRAEMQSKNVEAKKKEGKNAEVATC